MIEIKGKVVRVTYYNSDNGYGVIRLKVDQDSYKLIEDEVFGNEITVVSSFTKVPFIDEVFTFKGEFVESKYGRQFKGDCSYNEGLQSESGIIAYLSSDEFPGIGEVTAKKIYDELGKNTLELISQDKSCLDRVKGLKQKQKDVIYDSLSHYSYEQKLLATLLGYGLSLKLANVLIKEYKSKAVEVVKENPYSLIDHIRGIGFLRADDIARKVGIDKGSALRLKALIIFVLNQVIYDSGNTYMHLNDLYIECLKFLRNEGSNVLNKDNYVTFINELTEAKRIIVDEAHNVYEVKVYFEENCIARKMYSFLSNKGTEIDEDRINDTIKNVERKNKIIYNDKQREAIKKAILEPVMILTGGPGTGKSTVIKGIIDVYTNLFKLNSQTAINENIKLAAPTGRAAKRLKEVTNHEATTIHKLLGYTGFEFTTGIIDAKLLIIDEFSMVDTSLAYQLFKAVNNDTKLILVGDADQLPAIGPGDILNDLILSKEICTIKLTHIHRQANGSNIIELAHNIDEGRIPSDILEDYEDRRFIKCLDESLIGLMVYEAKKFIDLGYDLIEDIQILVPMYNVSVGINAINQVFQDEFNPLNNNHDINSDYISENGEIKKVNELKIGGARFRINDKVIQLINRADKGIMNGDIGYITSIDVNYKTNKIDGLTVKYDVGEVSYEMDELNEIRLAYAISIHKSQGSEFKIAIVPFSFKYYIMLKRKLIYTAVTRAKEKLIMLGNFASICKGVTAIEDKRRTLLKEKLVDLVNNSGESRKYLKLDENLYGFETDMIIDENDDISPYDFM
ncbi:MAG: ATP-dependent RecD-like DNA helicase [Bacilli bacterium]|nr:ATP-dependent RecD-like DNA helicase [Bacilli bacterium]